MRSHRTAATLSGAHQGHRHGGHQLVVQGPTGRVARQQPLFAWVAGGRATDLASGSSAPEDDGLVLAGYDPPPSVVPAAWARGARVSGCDGVLTLTSRPADRAQTGRARVRGLVGG